MKGLAVTILLAVLEVSAMATSGDDLLTSDVQTVPAIRKEEAGIQSEVLFDAERPEVAAFEPAVVAATVI